MKVKRIGITEILRRIWLFSAKKIKNSESFSKQTTQLIVKLNSSLRQIIDSLLIQGPWRPLICNQRTLAHPSPQFHEIFDIQTSKVVIIELTLGHHVNITFDF